jgi:ABC-type transport system substrate-binding protein
MGTHPGCGQLIQDQWRAVGIRATLKPVSGLSALLEQVSTGEYNLAAFYTFGLDPYLLSTFYASNDLTQLDWVQQH